MPTRDLRNTLFGYQKPRFRYQAYRDAHTLGFPPKQSRDVEAEYEYMQGLLEEWTKNVEAWKQSPTS